MGMKCLSKHFPSAQRYLIINLNATQATKLSKPAVFVKIAHNSRTPPSSSSLFT